MRVIGYHYTVSQQLNKINKKKLIISFVHSVWWWILIGTLNAMVFNFGKQLEPTFRWNGKAVIFYTKFQIQLNQASDWAEEGLLSEL